MRRAFPVPRYTPAYADSAHRPIWIPWRGSSVAHMDENKRGSVRVEPSPKRVRSYLAGRLVANTRHASLVWEI